MVPGIVIKKRIWFHFDGNVMDMWWKSGREQLEGRRQKKLAQNPLSEPFNRLICIVPSKVDLKSHHEMREQKVVGTCDACHTFFHSETSLEMCKKYFNLWLDESAREKSSKRIFNCPGNSDDHSDSIHKQPIFYLISDEFHYQTKAQTGSIVHP